MTAGLRESHYVAAPAADAHYRLPLAAIIAGGLILVLELFLHATRYRLVDGIDANLLTKRALLERSWPLPYPLLFSSAPDDDIAIFGDSKLFSVRTDAVASALAPAGGATSTPLRITNYAWPFFGIEAYELMLDNYLRHRPPPRAIILNGRSELIGAPAHRNSLAALPAHRQRAFMALPLRQIFTIAWRQRQWSLLWHRVAWALTPPSVIYRETAPEVLRDIARGRGWPRPSKDYLRMTTSYRKTGGFLMHHNRQVTAAEINALEQVEGPYAVHQNHQQAASFERFLARAARADIKVLILGSPAPPQYHERFQQLGIHQAHRAVLTHWQREFRNLHIIGPLHPVQPLHHFGDPGHLNSEGDAHFQSTYPAVLAGAADAL